MHSILTNVLVYLDLSYSLATSTILSPSSWEPVSSPLWVVIYHCSGRRIHWFLFFCCIHLDGLSWYPLESSFRSLQLLLIESLTNMVLVLLIFCSDGKCSNQKYSKECIEAIEIDVHHDLKVWNTFEGKRIIFVHFDRMWFFDVLLMGDCSTTSIFMTYWCTFVHTFVADKGNDLFFGWVQ